MQSQHLLRYRVDAARQQAVILTDNIKQSNINPLSGLSELTMYDMFCFVVYKSWEQSYKLFSNNLNCSL